MSAYIVDRHHILYLIVAATSRSICSFGASWYHQGQSYRLGAGDYDRAVEVANMLYAENVKSVQHRYNNEPIEDLPGPNKKQLEFSKSDIARGHWDHFDPVQVLQSCNCYAYQSCEHPGWEQSQSYAFIESLKSSAIHNLPGMDKAVWGAPEKSSATSISLSSLIKRN